MYRMETDAMYEPASDCVTGFCAVCGGEIYAGQSYGSDGTRLVHYRDEYGEYDCINSEFGGLAIEQRLGLLGYEIRR